MNLHVPQCRDSMPPRKGVSNHSWERAASLGAIILNGTRSGEVRGGRTSSALQWLHEDDERAMSTRSFRDRYAGALGSATEAADEPTAGPAWPLPRGARPARNAEGECVVHDRVYGGAEIAATFDGFQACLRAVSGRYVDPRDMIFLDTETTGLSGGTGTHVFLVGIGRFNGDALHVRQFFMRHPGDERGLLAALAADLGDIGALVTYNGRSFDVPLLETRYRMHGQAFASPEQHIDLLSRSRAIWKHRLPIVLARDDRAYRSRGRARDGCARLDDSAALLRLPALTKDRDAGAGLRAQPRSTSVTLARLTALVQTYEAGSGHPPTTSTAWRSRSIGCGALATTRRLNR